MDDTTKDEAAQADRFRIQTGGLTIAGLILAFCLSPLMAHANRSGLAWGGFLIAMSAAMFYYITLRPQTDLKTAHRVVGGLGMIGLLCLIVTFTAAMTTAEKFDRECQRQQLRMMVDDTSATPGEHPASGHDMFDAMGCRWVPLVRPAGPAAHRPASSATPLKAKPGNP